MKRIHEDSTDDEEEEQVDNLQPKVSALEHASSCRSECDNPDCLDMKSMIVHSTVCQKKVGRPCNTCKYLVDLSQSHARDCDTKGCPVPFCSAGSRVQSRRRESTEENLATTTPPYLTVPTSTPENESATSPQPDESTENALRLELEKVRGQLLEARVQQYFAAEQYSKSVASLVEAEFLCSICSDVFIDATITNCGHTFCKHCISEWMRTERRAACPMCRQIIQQLTKNVSVENFVTHIFQVLPAETQEQRRKTLQNRAEVVEFYERVDSERRLFQERIDLRWREYQERQRMERRNNSLSNSRGRGRRGSRRGRGRGRTPNTVTEDNNSLS